MIQESGESVLTFSTRLKEQAKYCEFPDKDDMIYNWLVCGVTDENLCKKVFVKTDWKLADFLKLAVTSEDSTIQIKQNDKVELKKNLLNIAICVFWRC